MICFDLESTGLYPSPTALDRSSGITEDYIVAIGILDDFGVRIFSMPHYLYQSSLVATEREILKAFCAWYLSDMHYNDILLGYNSKSFDVPFITTKLLKYDEPRFAECADLLLNARHIDLIDFSKIASGRRLSKDEACRKLGNLYVPHKTDGLWNARLYKNPEFLTVNDHAEMFQHNATDISATFRLYNVLKNYADFNRWLESSGQMMQ